MIDIRCRFCDRFLRIEPVSTTITKVVCPDRKCKKVNNIKFIFNDASPEQIHYKFSSDTLAKVTKAEDRLLKEKSVLALKLEDSEKYISQLEGILDGQG